MTWIVPGSNLNKYMCLETWETYSDWIYVKFVCLTWVESKNESLCRFGEFMDSRKTKSVASDVGIQYS